MLNAEKYKDELKENGEHFAVSKDGKLSHCSYSLCKECIFAKDNDCRANAFNWLLEEYKEPIKLSRFEYDFLKNISKHWKWIARDEDNTMWLYETKPHKKECEGMWKREGTSNIFNLTVLCFEDLFSMAFFNFIEWKDKEPYKIIDILKNCEVIENA